MKTTPHTIFSRRTLALLVGIGLLAFAGTLVIAGFADLTSPQQRAGANSYSTSAIGHLAFVELIRTAGLPVVRSRSRSLAKAGPNDLLIVAEPPASTAESGEINYMMRAHNTLVILPKWAGTPDRKNPDWISQAELRPANAINPLLAQINDRTRLVRTATLGGIIVSPDNSAPEIANPQLLRSDDINPIIETTNGILAGAIVRGDGSTVWILSDPDLLSNHGLLRGNNAALALTIVKRLVRPGGAVIVDETLHGFRLEPNLIRALFQLPFVVATIVFVASVGVLLWAVIGRFGAPMTQPATRVAGKSTLVDNIAVLMGASGHRIEILRRFLSQTTRDVARIFHMPHHLPDDRRTAWLDRVGKARSVTDSLPDLEMAARVLGRRKKLNERQIIDLAARAFRWRQEMMHGPERSPNR